MTIVIYTQQVYSSHQRLNNGGGHGYIANRTTDPSHYSAVVLERKLYGILKGAVGNLSVWETVKFY
jgi:hypothetical protein